MYFIQHCFICRPSDSTVSEDAGIEPRTVATLVLNATHSITTRLDLIRKFTVQQESHCILYNPVPQHSTLQGIFALCKTGSMQCWKFRTIYGG
jgi:hypothetical protein